MGLCASTALGQDIFEKEKGLYSTAGLADTVGVEGQDNLVIKSAGSLTGTITITVAEQDEVSLVYYKQARALSRSRAIDYIDLLAITLTTLPNYVRMELRAPNPPPWDSNVESGMIDAELVLPAGFSVTMEAVYYDLVARGPLRKVEVPSSLGRFDIADVSESVILSTKNRRVALENISGEISVSTVNSSLIATNLSSGGKPAVLRNESGEIIVEGFTGEINVKNDFGRTVIRDFSPSGHGSFIRGSSGPIELEIVEMFEGQLVVSNRYEDINITVPDTLSAYFSLAVDDGLIEAVSFPFVADLVERDRLSLSSGAGEAEIVASIRGEGNIYVRGVKGD
jgi:hypothetical protein